jgi:hypothetical protein
MGGKRKAVGGVAAAETCARTHYDKRRMQYLFGLVIPPKLPKHPG